MSWGWLQGGGGGGSGGGMSQAELDDAIAAGLVTADVALVNRVAGQEAGLKDTNNIPLVGIGSYTEAQFAALTPEELLALNGLIVRRSEIHNNTAGAGGVLLKRSASPAGWAQETPYWYFPTLAAALVVAPSVFNLTVRCGDVGAGKIPLRWNGTRFLPEGGVANLFRATYGTIAAPTNGRTTTGQFPVGAPVIPAGLLALGDELKLTVRTHKTGGANTAYFRACIGTVGDLTDAMLWEATHVQATLSQANGYSSIVISAAGTITSNRGFALAGTGSAPGAYDSSANFNMGLAMTFSIGLGSVTASDTAYLLGYNLEWAV